MHISATRREEYVPIKVRRMREEQQRLARLGVSRSAAPASAPADAHEQPGMDATGQAPAPAASESDVATPGQRGTESLLQLAAKSRKEKPEETEAEKALREEQDLLRQTTKQKALQGVQELARVRALTATAPSSSQRASLRWKTSADAFEMLQLRLLAAF